MSIDLPRLFGGLPYHLSITWHGTNTDIEDLNGKWAFADKAAYVTSEYAAAISVAHWGRQG